MDEHVTYLQQLQEDDGPVVLINEFNVPPEDTDRFIAVWADDAAFMKRQPGFISTQLHRGTAEAAPSSTSPSGNQHQRSARRSVRLSSSSAPHATPKTPSPHHTCSRRSPCRASASPSRSPCWMDYCPCDCAVSVISAAVAGWRRGAVHPSLFQTYLDH